MKNFKLIYTASLLVIFFLTMPTGNLLAKNNTVEKTMRSYRANKQLTEKSQIEFKKGTLKIKNKSINVEVAQTPEQHAYGLMNRLSLPENHGMLFVFPDEEPRSFWMKNTFIDLSIAYLDKDKKIIDIQDMKAVKSSLDENLPNYPSQGPAQYALEMNQGWFAKNNLKVGDKFKEFSY